MNRPRVLRATALILLLLPLTAEDGPGQASGEAVTLEDCFAYALVHNSELQRAVLAIEDSLLASARSLAIFDPDLGASYQIDPDSGENTSTLRIDQRLPGTWQLGARGTAQGLTKDGQEGLSYHVSLSKVLLGGGSRRASLQAVHDLRIDEALARNRHALVKRRLRRDVLKAYYAVVRDLRTRTIQERQVTTAERNLELAIERDRVIDITNAEIQLSESRDRVVSAVAAVDRSLDQLKRRIGVPVSQTLAIVDAVAFATVAVDPRADLAWALVHHEDILSQQLRIRKTDNALHIDRERLRPTVTLRASLEQRSEPDRYRLDDDLHSSVGLEFGWTIGNRAERADYQRRHIARRRQDLELVDILEDKRQEVRDLERRLDQGLAAIELAERRLAMRERLVTLYQDRYDNGEIDILELVRAQDTAENAQVSLLTARIRYLEAVADYRFAVGR